MYLFRVEGGRGAAAELLQRVVRRVEVLAGGHVPAEGHPVGVNSHVNMSGRATCSVRLSTNNKTA